MKNSIYDVSPYKEFLDQPIWRRNCPTCNKEIIYKSKDGIIGAIKKNSICKSCTFSGKNNGMYNKHHSAKTKSKISKTRIQLQIKHTDETKRKISIGGKGRVVSDETKVKMSLAQKGRIVTEKTKLKISKSQKENIKQLGHGYWLGRHHTAETRKLLSDNRIKNGLSKGKNNPMFGKYHTPETLAKIFNKRKMNKLEKLVSEILKNNNIEYYYNFLINEFGVCRAFDFKIKGSPIIIEIDGDYWHGGPGCKKYYKDIKNVKKNDRLKNKMVKKRNYNLLRIWESEIKKDNNIIMEKINNLAKLLVK